MGRRLHFMDETVRKKVKGKLNYNNNSFDKASNNSFLKNNSFLIKSSLQAKTVSYDWIIVIVAIFYILPHSAINIFIDSKNHTPFLDEFNSSKSELLRIWVPLFSFDSAWECLLIRYPRPSFPPIIYKICCAFSLYLELLIFWNVTITLSFSLSSAIISLGTFISSLLSFKLETSDK